jgi:talin
MKDFVAPQHIKAKDIEPGIFKIHKKFVGMSETNAKMRFVQLCRSLKTYGITYFSAKEASNATGKQTKKMKVVLIGITRDSFMKIDPETKEVLHTYQLKHIRRWAATKNNFTLDVGDYADSYMHFATPEAEKISQLLSGYIDIILKRTRGKFD